MKVAQVLLLLFISGLCSTFGFNVALNNQFRIPPLNVGVNPYSRFGSSIAFIGNFNTTQNNVTSSSEIYAVGASGYSASTSATSPGPGAVLLFNLNYKATSQQNPIDAVSIRSYSNNAYNPANGDQIGASVVRLNDADGDGFPELAVGAPGTNSNQGAVYILFLGAPIRGTNPSTQDLSYVPSVKYVRRIDGPSAGSLFGTSLSSRLAGNNVTDLLVGAPGLASGQGAFIYYSQISASPSQQVTFASSTQLSQSVLIGTSFANQGFGSSVVNIGDVNNDGVNDVAFGLPQGTPPSGTVASGVVYVSLMNASLNAIRTTPFGISTLPAGSQFGASLGRAGDFNKDGVPDFIVGAPGATGSNGGLPGDGAAYILLLNTNGGVVDSGAITCTSLTECSSQANLGSAVYYRENDSTTTGYYYLTLIGGSRKSSGTGAIQQGELWIASINLPNPSTTPSATRSPSLSATPSVSISSTPSVSPSLSPSVSPSISASSTQSVSASASASASPSLSSSSAPAPQQILPFLWNEKCFRVGDTANCGIGIGPGYYPPVNNYV